MTDVEKITSARKELGLTQAQMASELGLERSYLSQLENERKPIQPYVLERVDSLLHAHRLGVGKSTGRKEAVPFRIPGTGDKPQRFRAPVVSWASAGIGGDFSDLAEHLDEFVETDCSDPNCYALIVEGKSMEPELRAGDRIVVAPNMEAKSGDVVVARLAESGQVFLKVLEFLKSGKVKLSSYNKDFREIELSREEFRFIQPVYGLANRRLKR